MMGAAVSRYRILDGRALALPSTNAGGRSVSFERQREASLDSVSRKDPDLITPRWVIFATRGWVKVLVVICTITGALSPIMLKIRADTETLNQKRFHNNDYIEQNPGMKNLSEAAYNYCHATFPGALPSLNYTALGDSHLVMVQVVTRHGDRAPCNVLPYEGNVTWMCEEEDPFNPDPNMIKVNRVRDVFDDLSPLDPPWAGTCGVCDLTPKGMSQHHILGEALGAIYSQYFDISPNNLFVRSTDTMRTKSSARAFIRGLLSVAVEAGSVRIGVGMSDKLDILRPQPEKCPALDRAFKGVLSSWGFNNFMEVRKSLRLKLTSLLGIDDPSFSTHAHEWESNFDHFFDNIHSRWCHDQPLPCGGPNILTPTGRSRHGCVTQDVADELFDVGDFEFNFKYGKPPVAYRKSIIRLGIGLFLNQILSNMEAHTIQGKTEDQSFVPAPPPSSVPDAKSKQIFLYSAHDDSIGVLLGALQTQDYRWPPYASNLIFELWRKSDGEHYVRVLYNGVALQLPFCTFENDAGTGACLAELFISNLRMSAVPEDWAKECA